MLHNLCKVPFLSKPKNISLTSPNQCSMGAWYHLPPIPHPPTLTPLSLSVTLPACPWMGDENCVGGGMRGQATPPPISRPRTPSWPSVFGGGGGIRVRGIGYHAPTPQAGRVTDSGRGEGWGDEGWGEVEPCPHATWIWQGKTGHKLEGWPTVMKGEGWG